VGVKPWLKSQNVLLELFVHIWRRRGWIEHWCVQIDASGTRIAR
jgi:hypothetical protein